MAPRTSLTVRDRLLAPVAATPLSLALAAACVAMLGWVEAHGSSTDPATLVRFGALERSRVWSGEVWRLLAAPFLHVGWIHLAWNVLMGIPWCRPVERVLGPSRFLLVYLASAVGASALSLLGQDVVSAGASGPLFGVVGATLALHLRAVGSWRAFLASRAARRVLAGLAAFSIVGGLLLPLDQLAHGGGLAVGAVAAWLLSRPRPAHAVPWIGLAAVLAGLTLAAAWPRETVTRFEGRELEKALHQALLARDVPAARELVARAEARRHESERLRYYRALLLVQEDDLESAIPIARSLLDAKEPALREEATKTTREMAKLLGYRHYTGDGAARDPALGLAYLEEACGLGDEESCRNARKIRGF
jgi:membrane associated rhomboid family serine protease